MHLAEENFHKKCFSSQSAMKNVLCKKCSAKNRHKRIFKQKAFENLFPEWANPKNLFPKHASPKNFSTNPQKFLTNIKNLENFPRTKINLVTQFVHPPRLIMLLLERFSNEIKIESKVGNKVCLQISDAIFDHLTKSTLFMSASATLPRPLPTSMLLQKWNYGYDVFENWLNGFEKSPLKVSATCGRYWISRSASDIGTDKYQLIAISGPVPRVMSVVYCSFLRVAHKFSEKAVK